MMLKTIVTVDKMNIHCHLHRNCPLPPHVWSVPSRVVLFCASFFACFHGVWLPLTILLFWLLNIRLLKAQRSYCLFCLFVGWLILIEHKLKSYDMFWEIWATAICFVISCHQRELNSNHAYQSSNQWKYVFRLVWLVSWNNGTLDLGL